jgi:hypothetical protein
MKKLPRMLTDKPAKPLTRRQVEHRLDALARYHGIQGKGATRNKALLLAVAAELYPGLRFIPRKKGGAKRPGRDVLLQEMLRRISRSSRSRRHVMLEMAHERGQTETILKDLLRHSFPDKYHRRLALQSAKFIQDCEAWLQSGAAELPTFVRGVTAQNINRFQEVAQIFAGANVSTHLICHEFKLADGVPTLPASTRRTR